MTKNSARTKRKRIGRPPKNPGLSLIIRQGVLPADRRHLRTYLAEVRAGLVQDVGGTEAGLTMAQRVLVDRVVSKLAILRCIEEQAREAGVFEGGRLSPVLAESYLGYANSIRLDLRALGLDRREADGAMDIRTYIKDFDERAKAKDAGAAPIVQPTQSLSDVSGSGGPMSTPGGEEGDFSAVEIEEIVDSGVACEGQDQHDVPGRGDHGGLDHE